ncbi:MAG: tetratricopeptide repeat protein [bacterium]
MAKISKNELKRNEIIEWLKWLKLTTYYFKNNLKVVIITVTSIIFIIIIGSSILLIKGKNNKLSAAMLSQAVNVYHFGGNQAGEVSKKSIIDSISLLKNVIEKYPHTQSASIAYYYLGNLNYQLADYQQSLLYYKDFINKYPNHTLVHSVQKNMAYIYEFQKNFDEAAKIYENLINTSDIDPKQKDSLKLNLARIYELQNQLEKAKAIYLQFPDDEEAQFRLSCLTEKK